MPVFLTTDDLEAFITDIDLEQLQAMIDDATALAFLAAPCLDSDDLTDAQLAAVKAILRSAILRWYETGSGAVSQQTAGPFGQMIDTRQPRRGMFWPSDITALQGMCSSGTGAAFQVDTLPYPYRGYRWLAPDIWIPIP